MSVGQQYWYAVEVGGAPEPAQFGYTAEGIIPNDLLSDFSVTPFGEGGSMLKIDYAVPVGINGASWSVSLAFRTVVVFSRPLPLDQFSAPDSSYEFDPPAISPDPPTTLPVRAVTPLPPPA
jgi:hypothetical protein